jgi:2-polyprenyl-3-methyl-5-hydroxy-6-metoxy-1,4-benzoquinol methylase
MNEFWEKDLTSGYYDEIVKKGLVSKKGVQSFWHITTLNKISHYLIKDLVHLDYACGPGTLIGLFSKSHSTGVDIAAKQINFASSNYSHKGDFYQTKDFTFSKKRYDIITVIGLIEFIEDDEFLNLIDELEKCLKSGGKIVFTTPNYSGLMNIYEYILNYFGDVDYEAQHINKKNVKSTKLLLASLEGFQYKVEKFLNMSIIFSIFSHRLATTIENLISKIFKNYFGSLLIVELVKK